MKIKINYDRHEYLTREACPEDDWDRGDTAADISIHGEVADGYHDIDAPFDVEPEVVYYLVWANYNTGDSFGSDHNRVEFIDLFKTKELAEDCADIARAAGRYNYIFTRENGRSCTQSIPWNGYFESLNSIEVKEVELLSK